MIMIVNGGYPGGDLCLAAALVCQKLIKIGKHG